MGAKHIAVAASGGIFSVFAGSASAAVGVYYIDAYLDTLWEQGTTQNYGPQYADAFGSEITPSFLSGTFTFDHVSSVAAPESVVGIGGYATADSWLDASISGTGFSMTGGGTTALQRGTGSVAQAITTDLIAYLSFNFIVPAGGEPQIMTLSGTAIADSQTNLFLRISELSDGGSTQSDFVYLNRTSANLTNYVDSWDDETFLIVPGNYYVFDFWAQPLFTSAPSTSGAQGGTSEINLTATFADAPGVPEPASLFVLAGGMLVLLRRRRRCA